MADIPDDDINLDSCFEKADEVAKLSPEEQEAWLRLVAEPGQGEPGLEDTLQKLRKYLAAARRSWSAVATTPLWMGCLGIGTRCL